MTEKTLILIKPDGVKRGLTGEILRRIEAKGYLIEQLRMLQADAQMLAAHYAEHVHKSFYPTMADYMQSGKLVAAVVSGTRVVAGVRALAGATDPTLAAPGTIRGDFARAWEQGAIQNLVHSSDSPESAQREIAIWFS